MTYSQFDDAYDEHEKIEDAWFSFPPNPVGLHVMATTACNRWLSDGVIRPRWIEKMLPKTAQRKRILEHCVTAGLLDELPAGTTTTVTGRTGDPVELGPFPEHRYLVHDFLDRHDSAEFIKARRAHEAAEKRRKRAESSARRPSGVRSDTHVDTPPDAALPSETSPPRARTRAPTPASRPDQTRPIQTPPTPPPSAGGQRPNPRAAGSNPRAIAVRRSAETALVRLDAPSPDKLERWELTHAALQGQVQQSAWHNCLAELQPIGVDDRGYLVVHAPGPAARRVVSGRFDRLLTALGTAHGVKVRFATDAEHAAADLLVTTPNGGPTP